MSLTTVCKHDCCLVFVVQVSSERPVSQGYERVSTEEPQDGFMSCEADNTESVRDEVSYSVILSINLLYELLQYCVVL
jgi:hypothetical protein